MVEDKVDPTFWFKAGVHFHEDHPDIDMARNLILLA